MNYGTYQCKNCLITGVSSLHRPWAQSWKKPDTRTRTPRTTFSTPRTSGPAATSTRPCVRSVRATPSRGLMSSRPCRRPQRPQELSQIPHEGAVQQCFSVKCDVIAATPDFKDPEKHGADKVPPWVLFYWFNFCLKALFLFCFFFFIALKHLHCAV